MKRVLFVDDEPRILEGLQRMLRAQRREWEMVFALGGEAALDACAVQTFDVVVSDMRMPGMDGATLLSRIQERHPATVRIILSGQTDSVAAARASLVAHQFLMKPTNADTIRDVINRAHERRLAVPNDAILRAIGEVETLPALPRLYAEISALVENANTSAESVAEVIAQDVSMSAKILHLVNSSFFAFSREVTSLRKAVVLLGTNTIRNLVLCVEVFRAFARPDSPNGFSCSALQAHSMWVSRMAGALLSNRQQVEEARVAGMLHDIGKLVLSDRLTDQFDSMIQAARQRGVPLHVIEHEALGITHADVGAYLLGLWNLPEPIVDAVAHHHQPRRAQSCRFGPLAAVHIANTLARERTASCHESAASAEWVDTEYLSQLGLLEQLPAWRILAAEGTEKQSKCPVEPP